MLISSDSFIIICCKMRLHYADCHDLAQWLNVISAVMQHVHYVSVWLSENDELS